MARNAQQGDKRPEMSIARGVRHCTERAGYDPAGFSGRSLNAGFLTSAAARGATVFKQIRRFARTWFRNLRAQGFFGTEAVREPLA